MDSPDGPLPAQAVGTPWNCIVANVGTGQYRVTYKRAPRSADVVVALAQKNGFGTCTHASASTATIDILTADIAGHQTNRDFSFSIFGLLN